jgi:hypothetical protein
VVRAWDQEVCSLCGLRFEPCGCSYDGHRRLTWSLTSGPVGLVEVHASWPGHPRSPKKNKQMSTTPKKKKKNVHHISAIISPSFLYRATKILCQFTPQYLYCMLRQSSSFDCTKNTSKYFPKRPADTAQNVKIFLCAPFSSCIARQVYVHTTS